MASLLEPDAVVGGKYRVLSRLGGGGTGDVYVVEQAALDRHLALKILKAEVLNEPGVRALFIQEARIAGAIGSTHIVQVFDAGVDDRTQLPFFVMELLDGQDLQRAVDEQGPFAPDAVLAIMAQVARGLDKAHAYLDKHGQPCAIVHRDLKPENLFLTKDDEGQSLVKILDFGVAKILRATGQKTQALRGTPIYCAPEQYEFEVVPQTDIWAFGLIALFLLTGRYYWNSVYSRAGTPESLMREILMGPQLAVSQQFRAQGVNLNLPAAFDAWFAKCVHREPSSRFATAGVAAKALKQVFKGAQQEPRKLGIALGRSTHSQGSTRTLPHWSMSLASRLGWFVLALGLGAAITRAAIQPQRQAHAQRIAADPRPSNAVPATEPQRSSVALNAPASASQHAVNTALSPLAAALTSESIIGARPPTPVRSGQTASSLRPKSAHAAAVSATANLGDDAERQKRLPPAAVDKPNVVSPPPALESPTGRVPSAAFANTISDTASTIPASPAASAPARNPYDF